MNEAPNCRRLAEFKAKLTALREWSSGFLERYNGAVRVRSMGAYRCIGVTTLLTNYYIPSAEDQVEIAKGDDRGKALGFAAFKPNIDKDTYSAYFTQLDDQPYEGFDSGRCVGSHLANVGITLAGLQEFMVGSRLLVARETPAPDAPLSYLVGAIDEICYNERTGKLVLLESKQSRSDSKYIAMKTLFLKEKHCKQLSFYAMMFLFMCNEAGIDIKEEDIELVIVGQATTKRRVASWRFGFDRITFLGEQWASDRWHPILCRDPARNAIRRLDMQVPCCSVCGGGGQLMQDCNRLYCSEACWAQRPICVSCDQTASFYSDEYKMALCAAHASVSS